MANAGSLNDNSFFVTFIILVKRFLLQRLFFSGKCRARLQRLVQEEV